MFIARGSDREGRWPDAPRLFSTRHQFLRHCAPYLSRVLSIPRSVSTTINTEFRGIRAHSDPQDATSFRHFPQQFARFMHANSMRFSTNCRLTISTRVGRVFLGGAGTGNGRGILYSISARRGWCFRFGELFELLVNFFKK